jgi:putative ABC transport system permease protein
LLLAWGILAAIALFIRFTAKRLLPSSWSYVWRQGLANLYRPQNQTLVLMFAIGLGTCLIMILFLTHRILIAEVSLWGSGQQPNMVLFDIQPDQTEPVRQLVGSFAISILQEVPIVTMRLASIRGGMVADMLKDPANRIPEFALQREYRSTFRDHLIETEKLVMGKWQPRVTLGTSTILISLEEGIAKALEAYPGDELIFDVQGVPVKTRVGSLRRVQWERVQPNFFVLFPAGVLETAPHFDVMVLKTPSTGSAADLQRALVQNFGNISAIDLQLIVSVVDEILAKISLIVRFIAGFSIVTGLVVLAVSVLSSRYQRQRESVLLRTLGARSAQVLKIFLVEYFLIGIFATFSGLLLAWAGSWCLARFVFEAPFTPVWGTSLITVSIITVMVICIGLWNSRGIVSTSPLEVLRREG